MSKRLWMGFLWFSMISEDEDVEDELEEGEGGEETIEASVEAVETDVMLHEEIGKEIEKLAAQEKQVEVADVELVAWKDSSEEEKEEEERMPKVAKKMPQIKTPRTLQDLLKMTGFENFQGGKGNENEVEVLHRVRHMCSHMQKFSESVRVAEKLISRAAVTGEIRRKNQQQEYEHMLAEARLQFHCDASRQSRYALWTDYSHRALEATVQCEPSADPGKDVAVAEVKSLISNSSKDQDGNRLCQLLVVRPFQAGGEGGPMRLAIVTQVFRGGASTKKKRGKNHVWVQGPLPISAATKLHVKFLVPQNTTDENGFHTCVCSGLTPSVILDAHGGGVVLEICKSHFRYSYESDYLVVHVSNKAVQAVGDLSKANVPFSSTKKGQKDDLMPGKTFFSEDDFARSNVGLKNLKAYLNQMKFDFEHHFHSLEEGATGDIKLRNDLTTSWPEVLARAPSYFKRYQKQHPFFSSLSKESQQLSWFGLYFYVVVWECLGWPGPLT